MTLTVTVAYDANGNTLADPSSKSYSWDFENRLVSAAVPGTGTVAFKYDPFGRRIYKSSPSFTGIFAYDGDNLIETTNGSGVEIAGYTQTQNVDEPLAEFRSGGSSYYEADGLGSVTSLSSAAGALANTYIYDSFGNATNFTGTLKNPFQYTARESDQETGLYYNRARYYNPATGRFLSEDPINFEAGVDFYSYVRNNPGRYTDPYGRSTFCPAWLWGCPDYWKNQQLLHNQESDQEIYNITSTAYDPFCLGKPGMTEFLLINQLEYQNLLIDTIESGWAVGDAVNAFPELLNTGPILDQLLKRREQYNQQIDELLQQAAQEQQQANQPCARCKVGSR